MPEAEVVSSASVTSQQAAAKGKSRSPVLLLVALSVLVMVLTPVITIVAVRAMAPKEETEGEVVKPQATEVNLPPVQVNVADTGGMRYLQLEMVVVLSDPTMTQFFQPQSADAPLGQLNRIQATCLGIVSDKSLNGLLSKEAKTRLAEEIKNAINEILRDQATGMVTDVYFTGFLVQ